VPPGTAHPTRRAPTSASHLEDTLTEPRPTAPHPHDDAPRGDDETTLAAGVPGPSGTGEKTTAGADPDAPATSGAATTEPAADGTQS